MTFAQRLNQLKKRDKFSQKQIAIFCGYDVTHGSIQHISNICRGLSYPPKEALEMLCQETGWNYKDLVMLIITEKVDKMKKKWNV